LTKVLIYRTKPLFREGERGRKGEREKGRMGEREKGRMGEWENGRMGEWENGRWRWGDEGTKGRRDL
jgi:hypothetical protein